MTTQFEKDAEEVIRQMKHYGVETIGQLVEAKRAEAGKRTQPIEVHEGVSWQYPTPEGTLHLGDWGAEFCDKVNAFTISLSMEDLEDPSIPQVCLTVRQARALIERLEDVIEPFENLVPVEQVMS